MSDELNELPSIQEIDRKFIDLINETLSREEVSGWSRKWVNLDIPPEGNDTIWDALSSLDFADLKSDQHTYLYGKGDFEIWYKEFKEKQIQ